MTIASLREEWADLLSRRREFQEALSVYAGILEAWERWEPLRLAPLAWSGAECRARWERGLPLLVAAPPAIGAGEIEDLLGAAMEAVAALDDDAGPGLQRLAAAWDRGEVGPAALLPAPGRLGSGEVEAASGLPTVIVSILAVSALRPPLEAYLAPCHAHLDEHAWRLGTCPFCGSPPSFSDVLEGGQRRLACHLCGGGWRFSRSRCAFCGTEESRDLVRLEPEEREQGWVVAACRACGAYVKELDRRVRWNGQSALIEDWGSPHLDLVARRAGFRRPLPTLLGLA